MCVVQCGVDVVGNRNGDNNTTTMIIVMFHVDVDLFLTQQLVLNIKFNLHMTKKAKWIGLAK